MVLLAGLALAVSSALAAAPVVTIGTVGSPGYTTIEISGEVDPEGEPVSYVFEVSTDGVGWQPTNLGSSSSATDPQQLSGTIQGLQPETHYFVRLTATNGADGTVVSSAEPNPGFTTLGPIPKPTVTISPVTTFTDSTAILSGKIDPGAAQADPGFNVHWHFECEPACLNLTPGGGEFTDDGNEHVVESEADIEPNTDYTIKLVAENAGGFESDQTSFHSAVGAPIVETVPAFSFGEEAEALIGGKVNPRNSETKFWIEYGPGPGGPGATYPSSIPTDHEAPAGSGGQFVFAVQRVSGLMPASTYHFRIVAENSAGTTEGEDLSFETPAATPPPATCPNDVLRNETGSGQLGECRAYELVTPADKNGGDANMVLAHSADGNRLGYESITAFGDTEAGSGLIPYLAQRTDAGWTNKGMGVPAGVSGLGFNGSTYPADFTNDLSGAIQFGDALVAEQLAVRNIFIKRVDGSASWVTKPGPGDSSPQRKGYSGRSADGSHIIFESTEPFTAEANGAMQVWEWVNGEIRLASILPDGSPSGGASVGTGQNGDGTEGTTFDGRLRQPTAVSEDGSRIFFGLGETQNSGIFVRENGTVTRRLDLSQRTGFVGEPGNGVFVGAATDGSIVVFFSPAQLTDDATPEGGLYAHNLEDHTLRFLTAGATDPVGVQLDGERGASAISRDGTHVFFVARSVLVPGDGVAGGHNLYYSDLSGVHYITTLGDYDGQDWSEGYGSAAKYSTAVTPDARFFLFQSYERLTSFDNAGHQEIYRFDTSNQSLVCVSCGNGPGPATGDASMFPNPLSKGGFAESPYQGGRAGVMSAGGEVLFESTEALLPGDGNGSRDVYLYRDGRLSLISTGSSEYDAEVAGITLDGDDVFFSTRDSLVGQDIDNGSSDVYDARVNGGFPAPVGVDLCESESACQGAAAAPPGFTAPATTTPGRGNPPKHKKRPKRCKGKAKKKHGKCVKKKHGKHSSKSGRNH